MTLLDNHKNCDTHLKKAGCLKISVSFDVRGNLYRSKFHEIVDLKATVCQILPSPNLINHRWVIRIAPNCSECGCLNAKSIKVDYFYRFLR